jgi:hypothetical protein
LARSQMAFVTWPCAKKFDTFCHRSLPIPFAKSGNRSGPRRGPEMTPGTDIFTNPLTAG